VEREVGALEVLDERGPRALVRVLTSSMSDAACSSRAGVSSLPMKSDGRRVRPVSSSFDSSRTGSRLIESP
jgi:hypothetical protein